MNCCGSVENLFMRLFLLLCTQLSQIPVIRGNRVVSLFSVTLRSKNRKRHRRMSGKGQSIVMHIYPSVGSSVQHNSQSKPPWAVLLGPLLEGLPRPKKRTQCDPQAGKETRNLASWVHCEEWSKVGLTFVSSALIPLLGSIEYTRNFWKHNEEKNLSHTRNTWLQEIFTEAQNSLYLCTM
jgi:hypothetical protein